jgi:hypothetical protein
MSKNFPHAQVSMLLPFVLGSPALVLKLKNAETRARHGVTLAIRCVYSFHRCRHCHDPDLQISPSPVQSLLPAQAEPQVLHRLPSRFHQHQGGRIARLL